MEKVLGFLIAAVFIVGILLGIDWLLWTAWCWALPQIYPTGPEGFIRPGFWLFVVCALLVSWIGRMVFGRSKD